MADKAILYNTTLCTACRGCQAACKQWNGNDEIIPKVANGVDAKNWGSYENPPDLSAKTWLKMEFREVERGDRLSWLFNRRSCMHCTDAGCVKVCPSGALYHHELGFVAYDKDICTGCGYCVDACPFDVPRLDGGVFGKMGKCTLCTTPGLDRINEGWKPACVKSCPPGALKYGERDQLVAEGENWVAELKGKGYQNAYLYGDKELGGLHVLYILDDSPQVYGLPAEPRISAATVVWKDLIQPLGWAVGGATIMGLVLNYLVARANINRQKEKEDAKRSSKV